MTWITYTIKEHDVPRHDVNFIIKQARDVLELKNIKSLCMNRVPRDYGQLYTTHAASKLIEDIILDNVYEYVAWTRPSIVQRQAPRSTYSALNY